MLLPMLLLLADKYGSCCSVISVLLRLNNIDLANQQAALMPLTNHGKQLTLFLAAAKIAETAADIKYQLQP